MGAIRKSDLMRITVAVTIISGSLAARAGVLDSPHDFTRGKRFWNTAQNFPGDPDSVCGPCHQAHNTDSLVVPLWAHDTVPAGSFKMYNTLNVPNSHMQATVDAAPRGPSLSCLSCHDGTVAINQMAGGRILGGTPDPMPLKGIITKKADGSPDPGNLTHSHPISFIYDSILSSKDKGVFDPIGRNVIQPDNTGPLRPGSSPDFTIKNFLLNGGSYLECTSCHDVHNAKGTAYSAKDNPNLVIIAGSKGGIGSVLCLSCHDK